MAERVRCLPSEQFDVCLIFSRQRKRLAGGLPIGAFIADKEIMEVLTHNPMLGHITNLLGQPGMLRIGTGYVGSD